MRKVGIYFLLDLMLTYMLLALCFFLGIESDTYLTLISLSFLHALLLHRMGVFVHAAAHRDFCKNDKVINDLIYLYVLGWFFGISIEPYRKNHWTHHKNHGTGKFDPEDTYSKGFQIKFLFERLLPADQKADAEKETHGIGILRIISYCVHIFLFSLFAWETQSILRAVIYYALPIFFYLPLISHIRNCLEHTPISGQTSVTRSFKSSPLSFFLGAAGFKFHKEHHDAPNVEYWLLKAKNHQSSYSEVFYKLIRGNNG